MRLLSSKCREWFASCVPCNQFPEPPGDGTVPVQPIDSGEPAEVPVDQVEPHQAAESPESLLESANAKIRELESAQDIRQQEVVAQAEQLLFETMPELRDDLLRSERVPQQGYQQQGPYQQQPEPQQYYQQPGPPPVDPAAELSPEQRAVMETQQQVQAIANSQQQIEDRMFAANLDQTLRHYTEKYPHMDRMRVQLFLERQGEMADRVNLEKLCQISHEHNLREKQKFADESFNERMQKMREDPQNPPPSLPAGPAPGQGVQVKDYASASKLLHERLAASRFGKG